MAVEILMPELGESVHEGTVSRWLKKEGEFVKEDEPVVEIMTDKVNQELGAPASGYLHKILIPEGENVKVFGVMGIIDAAAPSTAAADAPSSPAPKAESPAKPEAPAAAPSATPVSSDSDRHWYSPLVRSIAKENNISDSELAMISGTGDHGRVTKKDIEGFMANRGTQSPAPSQAPKAAPSVPVSIPADAKVTNLAGMRKMIADAMVRSSAVPTVSTVTQVDVTAMVDFRTRNKDSFQEQHKVKLTYTPFFIKALAESLMEYPLVNSQLTPDNKIVTPAGVHIGIAVALGAKGDEGLIVPVIRDCHSKTLVQLAKDLEAIAKSARTNTLKPADVQGGTFTLTNPGTYGALFGTPMINAPQAGILGTYSIQKTPVIVNDMIAIRSIMHLVLTYDHRLIDGLLAGKFLAAVRDRLQNFDFFK